MNHPFITRFEGEYRFLSNFWLAPITFAGVTFPSNEHAYVYAKNPVQWEHTWVDLTPGQVKRKGRLVHLRSDWEEVKVEFMRAFNEHKYTDHKDLRELLLSTGEGVLVEGNHWHDVEWGVCDGKCKKGPHAPTGRNLLGRVLMDLRESMS